MFRFIPRLILSILILTALSPAFAGPPTASETTGTPTASGTPLGGQASPASAKATPTSADSLSAKTSITYQTDADTETLTQAIESYNREFQNEPIREINPDTVERLMKYGFLKTRLKTDGMVLREGKVFKTVRVEAPVASSPIQEGVGKSGESLAGTLDAASTILDEQAPVGSVNGRGNPEVKVVEQSIQIRNKGEYKETKIAIPRLPPPPQPKAVDGNFAEPRKDLLTETLSKGAFSNRTLTKTKTPPRQPPAKDPGQKVPTASGTTPAP